MDAAIDARRFGVGIALSSAFLEAAAAGYLTDTDWDGLKEDWLEQALDYTAAPCKGIRGPLARAYPRTARSASPSHGAAYRLADYLEQFGRRARRDRIPPTSFWEAVRFADLENLAAVAAAAENRGLLREAARVRKYATARGDASQAAVLVREWHSLHRRAADRSAAQWAVAHSALDDPRGVARLLEALGKASAEEQLIALADRAAAHTALDSSEQPTRLLAALRETGAEDQAEILVGRLPAEGHFLLFIEQADHKTRYRFGFEIDGSCAGPWGWDDLR